MFYLKNISVHTNLIRSTICYSIIHCHYFNRLIQSHWRCSFGTDETICVLRTYSKSKRIQQSLSVAQGLTINLPSIECPHSIKIHWLKKLYYDELTFTHTILLIKDSIYSLKWRTSKEFANYITYFNISPVSI